MGCKPHVAQRLRSRARSFVRQYCQEVRDEPVAVDLAEQVFQVTVLNHIVASSGLLWGLGPEFYRRAETAGA
eukprot:878020-Heterocapsa_arctica.AAC.1